MKNELTLSGLKVANFSKLIDGKETQLFVLVNKSGMELTVTNFGAKIVSLLVKDKEGKMVDEIGRAHV